MNLKEPTLRDKVSSGIIAAVSSLQPEGQVGLATRINFANLQGANREIFLRTFVEGLDLPVDVDVTGRFLDQAFRNCPAAGAISIAHIVNCVHAGLEQCAGKKAGK